MAWHLIAESVLDQVVDRVDRAQSRVLIASPFIGRAVGRLVGARIALSRSRTTRELDRRLLTAFHEEAFRTGGLSALALEALLGAGTEIRTIPNLHAKVVVVDDWVLVGSGNLTRSGLDHLNVELGLATRGSEAAGVVNAFEDWWRHATRTPGSRITRADLKRAARVESAATRRRSQRPTEPSKGSPLRNPVSKHLRQQLRDERRTRAIAALRSELDRVAGPPTGSNQRRMDATKAYRNVEALSLDPNDRDRHPVRHLLLEVLRRHPDESARGHAAWRLARDGWDDSGPTKAVIAAVDRARRTDPAFVVRRNAARALSALRA